MSSMQPQSASKQPLTQSLDKNWQQYIDTREAITPEARDQIMNSLRAEIAASGSRILSEQWHGEKVVPGSYFGPEIDISHPNIAFEITVEMLLNPNEPRPRFHLEAHLKTQELFEGPTSSEYTSRIEFVTKAVEQINVLRRSASPEEFVVDDLCMVHGDGKFGYRFSLASVKGPSDVKKLLGLLDVIK